MLNFISISNQLTILYFFDEHKLFLFVICLRSVMLMDKHMSELMKAPITESVFEHVICFIYCLRLMKLNINQEKFMIYLVFVLFLADLCL